MEDNYNLAGDADADSLHGGAASGLGGFKRFLRLAEKRPALLPPWWSKAKAAECIAVGRSGWSSLQAALEKSDLIEHYGNPNMPMQMRLLGEQVYGTGPAGQPGAEIIQHMMQTEGGSASRAVLLDMSGRFRR